MNIDLKPLSPNQIYHLMTQTLIPRPIAWVLTESSEHNYNLAPFSYFTAVSSNPPLIMISVGKKTDSEDKDTVVNIKRQQKCVVHIASEHQYKAVTATAATLPHGESELAQENLKVVEWPEFDLPRLSDCKLAFACELYEIQTIGNTPQTLLFLEVKKIFIDDSVASLDEKNRLKIFADEVKPLARLGASEYAEFGGILQQQRPD